ncbi:archaea-specific SMC-related protein [Sulfuracidifex tepidarius]|uniref:Chromosome partition protein Smc n=1 Tax=Sulfuracidifex tepidarius TaxID=1294262 RepID=A0A510DZN5_9CREN|nr:archaea-specific SMC-related protein [Sulfuracidifex tepidarius]BBG25338.1 Chromosome partition protein Smc [Sulfuracidifex tepidarius]BBG28132.1 Chromosome partition protein Smc [Sulfuracidifex tepidarius]
MKLRVSNIGGITEPLELEIAPGVTSYEAPNAYGKTSLSKALISLLTSAVKAEDLLNVFSDSAEIELMDGSKTYYRRMKRIKGNIIEEKQLIMDDDRALLLSYFSPENKLLVQILAGEDNVEWFISTTSKINEIKAKKEELEKLLQDAKNSRDEMQKNYNIAIELQQRLVSIDRQIEKLEKEKETGSAIISNTVQTISITRQNKLDEINSKINVKREELEKTKQKLEKTEEEIKEKESKVKIDTKQEIEKELKRIEEELRSLTSKRSELEIELKVLERVSEEIKEADQRHASSCYVCGSHVDPETWKSRSQVISKELSSKTNALESLRNEILNLNNKKQDLEMKLKDFDRVQNDIEQLKSSYEALKTKMETLQFQIQDLERQKREMEEKFNRTGEGIAGMRLSPIDEKINQLKKQRSDIIYDLQNLGIPTLIAEKISQKEREIQHLSEKVEEYNIDFLKRLRLAKEEFMKISNSILKEMEFNLTAEVTDDNKLVVRRNNAKLDIKKLSSSERTTIALILILSSLKSYFTTPYFIIDESAMTFDQKRYEKLLNVLKGISEYVIVTRSSEKINVRKATKELRASS